MNPDDVVIGFGGNVGSEAEIVERFRRAREALAALGDVKSAALYRTAPIGPEQAPFLNTAVRVRVPFATPAELVQTVLELEQLLGRDRRREARWGPRKIDLDILYWGDRSVRWDGPPALEVPHPRIMERRFVLAPLVDLYGDRFRDAEARVRDQAVEQVAETW